MCVCVCVCVCVCMCVCVRGGGGGSHVQKGMFILQELHNVFKKYYQLFNDTESRGGEGGGGVLPLIVCQGGMAHILYCQ